MPERSRKAALRRHYLDAREAAPPVDRALWSASVCRHVTALCEEKGIHAVAAFWPLGSEVDLRPLVDAHPYWNFVFPRILTKDPPRLQWGPRPLAPGAWGLQEPLDAPHALPPAQLVLVPGLAFAADGHRLGYGRGFYDAVLSELPGGVLTLAVGFSFQRCAQLPVGPSDVPVQGIADENGIDWLIT